MTEPLVSPCVDLRGFPFMPLDVLRLRDSDLAGIATGDEFRAAVLLWCAAWHQVPAASLPNDDRALAHLAGYGRDVDAWRQVRDVALHGFVTCDDGRLYHPVIAEKAIDAWEQKQAQQRRTAAATAARKRQKTPRGGNGLERDDQRHEDRNVHQQRGRERGIETEKKDPTQHQLEPLRRAEPSAVSAAGQSPKLPAKPEPGAVPERDKAWFDKLEATLREAASVPTDPHPGLLDLSPIIGLIDAGYSLHAEILPAIRAARPRMRSPPKTWKYFVDAIKAWREQKNAAASDVVMMNGHHHSSGKDPMAYMQQQGWDFRNPEHQRMLLNMLSEGNWPSTFGPRPGETGCVLPQDLVDRWRQSQNGVRRAV